MKIDNFFSELKRRNVYKLAAAYAVVSWLLIQAASIFFPAFNAPQWAMQIVILILAVGFPIALVFSWAFEITPEGIVRESEVKPDEAISRHTGRKIIAITIVFAVIASGLFIYQLLRARSTSSSAVAFEAPDKSIAVLPFDNLSRDPDNAFFAEGVQDEVLTRLAKVADLKVISRTSTQKYKSAPDNLREIAKQLGVMHVVEGSVQKASDQVRVNVQLINAMTDAHLWGDIYDRKLTDMFAVETEIAKTIADILQAKLSGAEKTAMSKKPTDDPEAYKLYLQGRFFWNKRTGPDLRRSIDCFNRAIAMDPNYAQAYAGLAQSWAVMASYNGGSPADTFPQAKDAANKALALEATSSDALAALGSYKVIYGFDHAGALKEYERAIQLNPNDATAHHWLAVNVFAQLGDNAREIAELKRALELDPLSLIINSNVGLAYLHGGRLDEASVQLQKTIEMDGSFYVAQQNYSALLEVQGRIAEAIAQSEKTVTITDDPVALGQLGQLYGIAGRKDEAQRIVNRLRESRDQRYTAAFSLALVYLGLGDKNEALNWLEQSYRERDGNFIGYIRVDPLLNALHGNPRFEALAEKIVPAAQFKGATTSK